MNPKVCILAGDIPLDGWVNELFPSAFQEFPVIKKPKNHPFYFAWRQWEKTAQDKQIGDWPVDYVGPFNIEDIPAAYMPDEKTISECISRSLREADFTFVYLRSGQEEIYSQLGYALGRAHESHKYVVMALEPGLPRPWFCYALSDVCIEDVENPVDTFIECFESFAQEWAYE